MAMCTFCRAAGLSKIKPRLIFETENGYFPRFAGFFQNLVTEGCQYLTPALTESSTPLECRLVESGAIQTVTLAGSTTFFMSMFQNLSSSRPSVNSTRRALPRGERDAAKAFQLSHRPGDTGAALADIQLHDLIRRHGSRVAHLGSDADALAATVQGRGRGSSRTQGRRRIAKTWCRTSRIRTETTASSARPRNGKHTSPANSLVACVRSILPVGRPVLRAL